ncbi:PREDICTED: protein LNK2-like isoform X2 [Tarenaya hassleriana]|uniref:protein LNK2-like isoform X2 n=1 Tax=Tarenaya hassleriana TaxID=28532 RepID=UPI00053C426A|nr:PREDICTED: protein LNK2-like isoform X2 [Tarenaya hassleriana]
MFDWNDEELTNIIWGDDGEADDHIVPLKERSGLQLNRKEWSEESNIHKPAEQKTIGAKIDLHGKKVESSSNYNVNEGISSSDYGFSTWPEPSLSKPTRVDQESSGIEVSNSLAEPAKHSSTSVEKMSELGKGTDIFHITDDTKEQSDFVDYSWANIGSFDDLDRMFSNNVPIFGDGSLSSADELWSSSKDVANSPSKSFPSILDSQNIEYIKPDFEQQVDQQFSLSGKPVTISSQNVGRVCATSVAEQCPGHKGQSAAEEQAYQQKKMLKFPKKLEISEARTFQDIYGTWTPSRNLPGQHENQLVPSSLRSSSMAMNSPIKLQGSDISQYPHMPNPYMTASGFGNLANPFPATPVLSTIQSPDLKTQLLHLSYNISPVSAISVNKTGNASARPLTMTPQEKVEKLRRRQQMQAMLAIQRQQQQFRHQVPGADQPVSGDNPLHLVGNTNLEEIAAQPSFDPNSPLEQDDSSNGAAAVYDNSAEFSVLYRLQDVVAKLDMGIRLCVRDSLFRLAGSAVKRHHADDTARTNKTSCDEQEPFAKDEARESNRYAGLPDTETVTNPIDRTVAHLLFHRPFEMSMKHLEGPESPASSKMETERKGNLPKCSTPESYITKQRVPEEVPLGTLASPEQQTGQLETSPCVDTSENTPNRRSSSAGGTEIEDSQ